MSGFIMGSRMCNYCRRNLPSPDLCGCDGEKAARHKEMDRLIAKSISGTGPIKLGTEPAHIAAQLREISRLSSKYDLRESIEGHNDAIGDSYIWRDLMEQCDILAAKIDGPNDAAFFRRAALPSHKGAGE